MANEVSRGHCCAGENKVLAGKAGAIDAVVAAMRAHVDNAGVAEQACLAMRNVCLRNGAAARVFCLQMNSCAVHVQHPSVVVTRASFMLFMLLMCVAGVQTRIRCWLGRLAPSMQWWRS